MNTWGGVQLQRAGWDSCVQSLTFVVQKTSNNKFNIPEPVLPLLRKWWVTYYPRVTKRKKKKKKNQKKNQTNSHSNDYSWVKIGVRMAEISRKLGWHIDQCIGNFREPKLLIRLLDFQVPYLFRNRESGFF